MSKLSTFILDDVKAGHIVRCESAIMALKDTSNFPPLPNLLAPGGFQVTNVCDNFVTLNERYFVSKQELIGQLLVFKAKKTSEFSRGRYYNNPENVFTRNGDKVTIISLDGRGHKPIKGYVGDKTSLDSWVEDGGARSGFESCSKDLVIITETEVLKRIVAAGEKEKETVIKPETGRSIESILVKNGIIDPKTINNIRLDIVNLFSSL